LSKKASTPLVNLVDYYIEKGYYVFTEAYHRKRGYCCKSSCRHCPYPLSTEETDKEKDKSG